MNTVKLQNKIVIENPENFKAKDTLECGQFFRYFLREDGSYLVYSTDKKAEIFEYGDKTEIVTSDVDYFENFFDLLKRPQAHTRGRFVIFSALSRPLRCLRWRSSSCRRGRARSRTQGSGALLRNRSLQGRARRLSSLTLRRSGARSSQHGLQGTSHSCRHYARSPLDCIDAGRSSSPVHGRHRCIQWQ